jgi:hypothetical protein
VHFLGSFWLAVFLMDDTVHPVTDCEALGHRVTDKMETEILCNRMSTSDQHSVLILSIIKRRLLLTTDKQYASFYGERKG